MGISMCPEVAGFFGYDGTENLELGAYLPGRDGILEDLEGIRALPILPGTGEKQTAGTLSVGAAMLAIGRAHMVGLRSFSG